MSPAWLCPAVWKVQEFFAIPAGSQPAFSREGLFEGWAGRGDPVTLEPHGFTLSAYTEAAESDMRKPRLQAKSFLCRTAQQPISPLWLHREAINQVGSHMCLWVTACAHSVLTECCLRPENQEMSLKVHFADLISRF